MKEVTIYSLGDPGTFVPLSTGDPTYYTERVAFEISKFLYQLNQEGISIAQPETDDLDSISTQFTSFSTLLETWLASATSEGTRGVPAVSRPSLSWLATIVTALAGVSGGIPATVIAVVVNVGVELILKLLEHAIIPETGDIEELCDIARSAFLYGSDESILKKALLDPDNGDYIAKLDAVLSRSIEVWIGNDGGIENISLVASES